MKMLSTSKLAREVGMSPSGVEMYRKMSLITPKFSAERNGSISHFYDEKTLDVISDIRKLQRTKNLKLAQIREQL